MYYVSYLNKNLKNIYLNSTIDLNLSPNNLEASSKLMIKEMKIFCKFPETKDYPDKVNIIYKSN